MRPGEWTLRSRRVVTPTGTRAADILIRGETIEALAGYEDPDREGVILDVGSHLVLPGLVDLHVHIQEPGREESEGFETATRAAAAGGVTTLVDLPIHNRPTTTDPKALRAKLASAVGKLWVDCGFHGGLIGGNSGEVVRLVDAGVLGIVTAIGPSTVDFPAATAADLRLTMSLLSRLGRPLLFHAGTDAGSQDCRGQSNPPGREVEAIRGLIALCRESNCRVHVLHLGSAEALPAIAEARAEGLPLTVETCPYYLSFAAEEIPAGEPRFHCIPPIRGSANRDRLWDGLRSGLIDAIGSGHLPCSPSEKGRATVNGRAVRPGISSLQLSLPAVWSGARGRGFTADHLARWMARRPAEIVGLDGRKGSISPGLDADFVVFDPDETFVVDPNHLFHRHPETPYEGRTLAGRVALTILRGQIVFESGRFHGDPLGVTVLRLEETLPMPDGLEHFNQASPAEALEILRRCCGSTRWAGQLAALRPFPSEVALLEAADRAWFQLDRGDRIEAFHAHPRPSDLLALRPGQDSTSRGPDGSPSDADWPAIEELVQADLTYEAKFGYNLFLLDPDRPLTDLLDRLRRRLANDPEVEFQLASSEQAEIHRRSLRALILYP